MSLNRSDRDPYNLERFVSAQDPIYPQVVSELRSGTKTSHWMWFIFPQIRGLGRSPVSLEYAISSRDEAAGLLAAPGPRPSTKGMYPAGSAT